MLSHILCTLLIASVAQAHMRFVCPRPESGNSGIKTGPCSKEGNTFEDSYADVTPGPLTLRFEETINHRGAPLRLTLNKYGDDENICMLLDHYPHNENGTMNIGFKCDPFNWDLGGCNTQHYVTVNIPDIRCDRCYLQLVSVMTDKYRDEELPCHQVNQASNNCSSYFSCANIKIRPTTTGLNKDISTCTDYASNLVGDWPYRPRNLFQAQMQGSESLKAEANFDVLKGKLSVTLPSRRSGMTLFFMHGGKTLGSAVVSGRTAEWSVPEENRPLLSTSDVMMSMTDTSKNQEIARGPLVLNERRFERDYYGRHGVDLTPGGWLKEPEFVGASATYPFAMEQHGSCVLDTKYYGASVVSTAESYASAVSVTLSDLHAWVRAASTGKPILSASLVRNDGSLPAMELPSNLFTQDSYLFSGMLDMTQVVRSGKFYDTVRLTLGTQAANVQVNAPLAEASVAPILSGGERVGEGIFTLGTNAAFSYNVVVNFPEGGEKQVTGMSVNGPARNTMVGQSILSLPVSSSQRGAFSSGSVQRLGVVGLDGLHAGQLYVDVLIDGAANGQRAISGQLSARKECNTAGTTCFSKTLTFGGGELNRYQKRMETNGYATFRLESSTLTYRITLRDVKGGEAVTSVYAEDTLLHQGPFQASALEDNVQVFQGTLQNPSSDLVQDLANGDLRLRVYTTVYTLEPIFGKLPPISALA